MDRSDWSWSPDVRIHSWQWMSLRRWASQAMGIDTSITNVATTFTWGTLLGREMAARIHCGNVS